MVCHFFVGILSAMLIMSAATAADIELRPDHPQKYVVVEGDTLWDISAVFLRDPWHWPDIWQANPQIEDPHLIYPGDIVSLVYLDGRPTLELSRSRALYKLSPDAPKVRELMLEKAIPKIPVDVIRVFLTQPRAVSDNELALAPYVVAVPNDRLTAYSGEKVYVSNLDSEQGNRYSVFRGGKPYKDPDTGEVLGYEAMYMGDANVTKVGEPSIVQLNNVRLEVRVGDRLLPFINEDYGENFIPRAPEQPVEGQIIAFSGDGVSQVGRYQTVALNLGAQDNLQRGDILSVLQTSGTMLDLVAADKNAVVTLPDERVGTVMVFSVFDKISYAIIVEADSPIYINDKVSYTE